MWGITYIGDETPTLHGELRDLMSHAVGPLTSIM